MIVKLFSAHKDKSFSDISTIFPTPFPTHPLVFSQITPKGAWEEGKNLQTASLMYYLCNRIREQSEAWKTVSRLAHKEMRKKPSPFTFLPEMPINRAFGGVKG